MKILFLFFLLLTMSCISSNKDHNKADNDYVLIEFAAKLEEDYHKIQNIPYEPDFHLEKSEDDFDDGQLDDHHHGHQ